jgi:glutamate carboxypeptidase
MTSEVTTAALAAVDRRAGELLPLLRTWVEINSFTGNIAGVNQAGDRIADSLAGLPLAFERRAGDGCGDHLLWTSPAWRDRPAERILLIGHHDTVFPPGTFEVWEEQGGRVRGPGVLDMKGGLVCVRAALAALADAGVLADLPVGFVSVGDEETGSLDSTRFLDEIARGARAALVFEAGRPSDEIVVARKGVGTMRVAVHGKAAHAGNDIRLGVNAVWALARFVDRAQGAAVPPQASVNVGTFQGGTSANTVPERAECAIDFRFVRRADGDAVIAELDRLARETAETSGARFTLAGGIKRPPLERTAASAALAARYGELARREGLGAGEAPLAGGGSDANTVSAIGVPAIDGLGPRGRGYHTHDEHIEVATLVPRIRALVRFLLAL